jgi:hypothetical protein
MSEQAPSAEPAKLVNRLAESGSPYVSQAEPKLCQPYPDID